jgi:hypothetical protein
MLGFTPNPMLGNAVLGPFADAMSWVDCDSPSTRGPLAAGVVFSSIFSAFSLPAAVLDTSPGWGLCQLHVGGLFVMAKLT